MRLLVTARLRRWTSNWLQKALRTLAEDLRHPGLRVKRVRGTQRIWEARASRSVRMTFETEGEAVILRTVGRHDEALGNP